MLFCFAQVLSGVLIIFSRSLDTCGRRDIGLNSASDSGACVFGMGVIVAVLNCSGIVSVSVMFVGRNDNADVVDGML